ncbi:MAG: FKBP-type peptidyl-prolyl cis-trans isomerase [Bacteroidales bacterium]
MKKILGIALLASFVIAACQTKGVKSVKLTNAKDSASYYMGFITAKQRFTENGMDTTVNQQAVLFGMSQAMKGEKIDDNAAYTFINNYLNSKYMAIVAAKQKEADKFMEENKSKPGIIADSAGFQYQVLVQGTGPKPLATDRVMVKYEGRLTNDTIFDSNLNQPEPAVFGLNQVIPGWGLGLQIMPVGSKYRLFIPPYLGYGEQGKGSIPPNSVLIFDVELVGIAPAAEAPKKGKK